MSRFSPQVLPQASPLDIGGGIAQALAQYAAVKREQGDRDFARRQATIEMGGTVDPIPQGQGVGARLRAALGTALHRGGAPGLPATTPGIVPGPTGDAHPGHAAMDEDPRDFGMASGGSLLGTFAHPFGGVNAPASVPAPTAPSAPPQPVAPGAFIPGVGFHQVVPPTPTPTPTPLPTAPTRASAPTPLPNAPSTTPAPQPLGLGGLPSPYPTPEELRAALPPMQYNDLAPGMHVPTAQSALERDYALKALLATREWQRQQALNQQAYDALRRQYGDDVVGPYAMGRNYAADADKYLTATTTMRGQDLDHTDRVTGQVETARHNRAEESTQRGQLGVAQTNSAETQRHNRSQEDIERERLTKEYGVLKPMERENTLAGQYNELPVVRDADKFATNAALTMSGVKLARAGNREGHLMAITGFLRQTHPETVVRPSDKGTLIETQGLPADVQMWVKRAVGKGGLLTPDALTEIEQATQSMIGQQRAGLAPTQSNFGARARAQGADSARVARDPFAALSTASTATDLQQKWDAAAAHLRAQGQNDAQITQTIGVRP